MSKFIVDKSFWEIFPEANVGVLLLDNVDNSGVSSENVIKLLKESSQKTSYRSSVKPKSGYFSLEGSIPEI